MLGLREINAHNSHSRRLKLIYLAMPLFFIISNFISTLTAGLEAFLTGYNIEQIKYVNLNVIKECV